MWLWDYGNKVAIVVSGVVLLLVVVFTLVGSH
jgi:hypothetical protein